MQGIVSYDYWLRHRSKPIDDFSDITFFETSEWQNFTFVEWDYHAKRQRGSSGIWEQGKIRRYIGDYLSLWTPVIVGKHHVLKGVAADFENMYDMNGIKIESMGDISVSPQS